MRARLLEQDIECARIVFSNKYCMYAVDCFDFHPGYDIANFDIFFLNRTTRFPQQVPYYFVEKRIYSKYMRVDGGSRVKRQRSGPKRVYSVCVCCSVMRHCMNISLW